MKKVDRKIKKDKPVPKLRFPGFHNDLPTYNLKEISIDGFNNGVFNDPQKTGTGYRLINVKDMYVGNTIDVSTLTLLELSEKEFLNNKVEYGDIFFTRSSIVKEGIAHSNVFLSQAANITYDGHLIRMRPDKNIVVPTYLAYQFKTDSLRKQFVKRGKTTTMTTIGQDDIASVRAYCPDRAEQKKIADFLSAVDKKIQQLTRKKALLEQYKKGVMQKIFSRKIRFKRENGKDYPDWEEKQLSAFLVPTLREVPTPSKPYLAIGVRSHCRGTFQKPDSDPDKIAMEKLFIVKENDLIVNITFAWEGAIAIVKKEDNGGLVSHRFPTYTFKLKKVLTEFFKYVIVQKRFRYTLDLISPGGAGRNRVLSKKELLKIKWEMPLIEEQKRIATFLGALDRKIEDTTSQLTQTQQFKKGLLQQMFV